MGAGEAKRKKQNKNETKNIFGYCLDGIKECNGQDSYHYFGFEVDNTNINLWEYMMVMEQKEKKHLYL